MDPLEGSSKDGIGEYGATSMDTIANGYAGSAFSSTTSSVASSGRSSPLSSVSQDSRADFMRLANNLALKQNAMVCKKC